MLIRQITTCVGFELRFGCDWLQDRCSQHSSHANELTHELAYAQRQPGLAETIKISTTPTTRPIYNGRQSTNLRFASWNQSHRLFHRLHNHRRQVACRQEARLAYPSTVQITSSNPVTQVSFLKRNSFAHLLGNARAYHSNGKITHQRQWKLKIISHMRTRAFAGPFCLFVRDRQCFYFVEVMFIGCVLLYQTEGRGGWICNWSASMLHKCTGD